MENSRKIKRIISHLDEIEDRLSFFTNGNHGLSKEFKELREVMSELAVSKKEDRARFAKKLKFLWNSPKD
jgi:regulator of replication initiation timing